MSDSSYLALIHNLSLLLAIALLFDLNPVKHQHNKFSWIQLPIGALLGTIGIVLILTPWVFFPGIYIDTRDILLSISGLFFGTIPTLVAMLIMIIYRIKLGGIGLVPGIVLILTSGLIGILWRHLRKKPMSMIDAKELFIFGFFVQVNMIFWIILFPRDMILFVLQTIIIPVVTIFPIGTMLLGLLLINRLRREKATLELTKNETSLHSLLTILQFDEDDLQTLLQQALDEAIKLTASDYGYLHSMSEEYSIPVLNYQVNRTNTDSEAADDIYNQILEELGIVEQFPNLEQAVIFNHYQSRIKTKRARKASFSCIAVPIRNEGRLVCLLCVLKQGEEYEEIDRLQLTLLMDTVWKVLERKKIEKSLSSIEWMLSKNQQKQSINPPEQESDEIYNTLTAQNKQGIIINSVGQSILKDIARDYLDLLDTCAIIFEADGNYALAMFSSAWCKFLDQASMMLCHTSDTSEMLHCGNWLCRESCWTNASKICIANKQPMDIECEAGLHIYSLPIIINNKAIGAISFGYGDPPKDRTLLEEIAEKYHIDVEQLVHLSNKYESRPPFIIELAKQRLKSSANLIEILIERNQVQKELQRSESLLNRIFDILPIGLWLADKNGKLYRSNSAAVEIWGANPLVDISEYGLFRARRLPSCTDIEPDDWALARTIREGLTFKDELLEIDTFDGKKKIILNYTTPINNSDEGIDGALVVNFDITERVQAEEKAKEAHFELQKLLTDADQARKVLLSLVEDQKLAEEKINQLNQELEQRVRDRTNQLEVANHELEAFAYSVSHDLRAPLRAMDGFSAALLEDYPHKLDEQGVHYLQRIQEASRRMGQLIEDLLHLSRVTRREIHMAPINLSEIANDIVRDLQKQSKDKKIEIYVMENMYVQADSHLLRIALENLITNAFKFSSKRKNPRIEIGNTQIDDETVFYVRDNGVGFNMKYVDKLFNPFQRLHSLEEFPGTGIGLVTVQRIINRHGGRIWPEAVLNNGATFYFTLGEVG